MDTAYKTRAFWMLEALDHFESVASHEEATVAREENPGRYLSSYRPDFRQVRIAREQGEKAARNAMAPAGSRCLTRIYVDRSGELLAEFA